MLRPKSNWQYVQCPVCGKPLPVDHKGVYCFLTPACNGVLVVPKKILQEKESKICPK